MQIFQSTLPTRGSDGKWFESADTIKISIHAPHEGERRALGITTIEEGKQFQSTLPTRGSDVLPLMLLVVDITFQSTLPTRGSDLLERKKRKWKRDFNPRSPRGGATAAQARHPPPCRISIHAPHEGERPFAQSAYKVQILFQSTLPTRGSDNACGYDCGKADDFNPRSPRGGATLCSCGLTVHNRYFNPRSPRGGATH